MANHSSILAWKIPWTEESDRLWSTGYQRVGHNRSDLAHSTHNRIPKRRDFTKRELQRSANLSKNSKQGTDLHIKVRKGSEARERTT